MKLKHPENGRYVVEVEQHGEQDRETFPTFQALAGQFFNYGLTKCVVVDYSDTEGEFTEEQVKQLAEAFHEGATHWSHRV